MPTIRRFLVAGFAAVSVAACSDSTADPRRGLDTTVTSPSTLELDTSTSERRSYRPVWLQRGRARWLVRNRRDHRLGGLSLGGLGAALRQHHRPGTRPLSEVGAAPVAEGMDLAEWQALMDGAAPAVCGDPSPVEETTLRGEPALAWTHGCTDGYDVTKLAAFHEGLGYIVFLASDSANDNAEDRQIFESLRTSFELHELGGHPTLRLADRSRSSQVIVVWLWSLSCTIHTLLPNIFLLTAIGSKRSGVARSLTRRLHHHRLLAMPWPMACPPSAPRRSANVAVPPDHRSASPGIRTQNQWIKSPLLCH